MSKSANVKLSGSVRPPIGLRPQFIVDEHRLREIRSAQGRYTAAGKEVPAEWLEEEEAIILRLAENRPRQLTVSFPKQLPSYKEVFKYGVYSDSIEKAGELMRSRINIVLFRHEWMYQINNMKPLVINSDAKIEYIEYKKQ